MNMKELAEEVVKESEMNNTDIRDAIRYYCKIFESSDVVDWDRDKFLDAWIANQSWRDL